LKYQSKAADLSDYITGILSTQEAIHYATTNARAHNTIAVDSRQKSYEREKMVICGQETVCN